MFRIRFHGRGGQGIKSASRVLGTAFFRTGYEVQDAPRYGAERRGAPIAAYVRAARKPIHERGLFAAPDLVVITDATLVTVPAAGIHDGVTPETVSLIASSESGHTWRGRLKHAGPIVTLPSTEEIRETDPALLGMACTGGATRLIGVIDRATLAAAIHEEIASLGHVAVERSLAVALAAFDLLQPHQGIVCKGGNGSPAGPSNPEWVDVPSDDMHAAVPDVYAPTTSERTNGCPIPAEPSRSVASRYVPGSSR